MPWLWAFGWALAFSLGNALAFELERSPKKGLSSAWWPMGFRLVFGPRGPWMNQVGRMALNSPTWATASQKLGLAWPNMFHMHISYCRKHLGPHGRIWPFFGLFLAPLFFCTCAKFGPLRLFGPFSRSESKMATNSSHPALEAPNCVVQRVSWRGTCHIS